MGITVKELVTEIEKINGMRNFIVHIDDNTKYDYYGGLVGKWVESDEVNKEVKHVKYVDWEDTLHIYLEECNYCD